MPADRIAELPAFIVLFAGLDADTRFVVDVTASTRTVLDSSLIFTASIVEYDDGVCAVVDREFFVLVSLQKAETRKFEKC